MQEAKAFFDAYRDAFPKGAAVIAAFYAEPCVTVRGGVVRVNATLAETTALFSEVDKQYRARGFTHGDYALREARMLGANAAVATVQWDYKSAAGATIWQTTFTYNLYKRAEGWKILVQTMHDE